MTDPDIPHPLRRALLIRASIETCPEHERERIITVLFPGLNPPDAIPILQEAAQARQRGNGGRSDQLINMLIQQDREARKT